MLALALLSLLAVQDPDTGVLLKQLEDENIEVREKAAATLLELGALAEPKVRIRAETATGELKARCEKLLAAIERKRTLEESLPSLKRLSITFGKGTLEQFAER